jgi:hypothetical protein
MPIIGHQITKILGKRGETERNIKINANVELKDVRKHDVFVAGDKKPSLDFEFEFTIKYGEEAGGININGILFYTGDDAELDKLDKAWKKDKKLEPDMVIGILNRAMELGYIESIPMAERLKLPPPMRLPRFVKEEDKDN